MRHPGRSLKAVLFDLDGTLIDTAGDFIPVVQTLRAEAGLVPLAEARIRATVSNGARALVTLALGLTDGDDSFEDRRLRLLDLYGRIIGRNAALYPGMATLLGEIEGRGLAWGIATNKPRALTESLLETLGLEPGSLVCPDDVAQRKPHPESIERACTELACVPPDVIYIGDHHRDIEAGRRAGAYTIAAAYGYIEDGDSAAAWAADAIAPQSEDVAALVFQNTKEKTQ